MIGHLGHLHRPVAAHEILEDKEKEGGRGVCALSLP